MCRGPSAVAPGSTGVGETVFVGVGVGVWDGVGVMLGVSVKVGVGVGLAGGVSVGVAVGVSVGRIASAGMVGGGYGFRALCGSSISSTTKAITATVPVRNTTVIRSMNAVIQRLRRITS